MAIYISLMVVVFAIVLSASRTGIISASVILLMAGTKYVSLKPWLKLVIIVCVSLLLGIGAYFFNKDSVNGRFLIWKCSWEMVDKSLLWGHGLGSFKAHYMDYQAEYFKKQPNSEYAMLADNVIVPFNEYISIMLDFGLLGLILLFVLLYCLLRCFFKNPNDGNSAALLSLFSVIIFSVFSYPFTYPFIWVVTIVDIYLLINSSYCMNMDRQYKKLLCLCFMGTCAIFSNRLYRIIESEYKWNKIAYQYPTDMLLPLYSDLTPVLNTNPYFLYNYAVVLFNTNHFQESLSKALQCRRYWANYDLELLLGNIYKSLKEYNEAKKHFETASFMCPCRFIPLYELLKLYEDVGNDKEAFFMATSILKKPVKVYSITIERIQFEANQILKKHCGTG